MKTSNRAARVAHAMAHNPALRYTDPKENPAYNMPAGNTPGLGSAEQYRLIAFADQSIGICESDAGVIALTRVSQNEPALKALVEGANTAPALLLALQSARLDLKHIAGMDPLDSRIPRILAALVGGMDSAITKATEAAK